MLEIGLGHYLTLAAIISEGSILIEDFPGSGKTTFAKSITNNLGFRKILAVGAAVNMNLYD